MIRNTFGKKRYFSISKSAEAAGKKPDEIPRKIACPSCSSLIWETELVKNYRVCPKCTYHFPVGAWERLNLLVDPNSFAELDSDLYSCNFLDFPGYEEKLVAGEEKSGLREAIITGYASIAGYKVVLGIMEPSFMMASMGSVVGEKVSRAVEHAIKNGFPLIMCTASGGARMQEGMVGLMQMAKTSAVLSRFHRNGLLYISIFTHPTTGGVLASFASLADIIIAEPGALVGFTGPRVISQTIGQKLPENFQRSEFLLEHGMVDLVVQRSQLHSTIASLLRLHQGGNNG